MKVIAQPKAGETALEGKKTRFERPLDMALCTIIPKEAGEFSIHLPATDWEDGLQAIYTFTYDGKGEGKEAAFPGTMRVVPVLDDLPTHCIDAADGNVTEDCILSFDKGRDIDIQAEISVYLTCDEVKKLNTYLQKWISKA